MPLIVIIGFADLVQRVNKWTLQDQMTEVRRCFSTVCHSHRLRRTPATYTDVSANINATNVCRAVYMASDSVWCCCETDSRSSSLHSHQSATLTQNTPQPDTGLPQAVSLWIKPASRMSTGHTNICHQPANSNCLHTSNFSGLKDT